jgi:hypothetical protein
MSGSLARKPTLGRVHSADGTTKLKILEVSSQATSTKNSRIVYSTQSTIAKFQNSAGKETTVCPYVVVKRLR